MIRFLLLFTVLAAPAVAQQGNKAGKLNKKYATVRLEADLSSLSENQKKMLPHLIAAAKLMDQTFWREAYGNNRALLGSLKNEGLKKFVRINYGPWDRLDGNKPFIEGSDRKSVV